jgi:tRNA threonylcarbamoyladenosine biosynthesis protein TsaB
MIILAFDTCFGSLSVAVRWEGPSGEWLLAEACEARRTGHAERLMPAIADVMQQAGLAFANLERIAVTLGPGTFTGVRSGIAAARGLALASQTPVVGTTSLKVMAHCADVEIGAARAGRALAVAAAAHRELVFFQLFGSSAAEELSAPALLTPADAARLISPRPTVVVASGAEAICGRVAEIGGQAEPMLRDLQPRARMLAELAPSLAPLSSVKPLYLRPPDARVQEETRLRAWP